MLGLFQSRPESRDSTDLGALRKSQVNMSATAVHDMEKPEGSGQKVGNHTRHDSFQMDATSMAETSDELPAKAQAMIWSRPVVEGSEIDRRVAALKAEAAATRVPPSEAVRYDPESASYRLWLCATILLSCFSIGTLGYYLAFRSIYQSFHAVFVVDWLVDMALIFNLYVELNVGFIDEDGSKIIRKSVIRKRYLRSATFAIDALACVPLDLFQAFSGWEPCWRINKYLRLWSLVKNFSKLQELEESPSLVKYIQVTRLVFLWLLLPNIFTTVRVLLVQHGEEDDDWKDRSRNLEPGAHHATLYLRSLHWCMGVMSGYSDGTIPVETDQYFFTLFVLNVGIITFAYTVGAVGAIGERNAQQSRDFQITVSAMHHFVRRYEIPRYFTKRITDYFAHRWESIKSNEKELVTAAELLEELPPCVRFDAVECMTAEALGKVPLFARVEEGFIHALTQKMEPVATSVGETLVKQGEVCDGLYIVLKGRLNVELNGKSLDTLGQGSCIGEQSMLTGLPANRTITSLSFCELYRLRREPFEELQHKFSATFEGFKQAAKIEAKNQAKQARVAAGKGGKGGGGTGKGKLWDGEPSGLSEPSDRGRQAGGWASRFLGWVPILPHSRTRAVWSGCLLIALGYEVLAWPFKVVFVGNVIDPGLSAADALADLAMLADLGLRSVLAYTENGELIADLASIRKRFRRKKVLIPLCLSACPFTLLLPLWPLLDARVLQSLRLLRAVRLVPPLFFATATDNQQPSNLEELLRQVRSSAFDLQFAFNKLVPLLALYALCVHYVACGYWAVVSHLVPPDHHVVLELHGGYMRSERISPTWANQTLDELDLIIGDSQWVPTGAYLRYKGMLHYYFRAFYFATCNLSGLGAAVVPNAVSSVLFTLACFIIGVMVFAYLTSAIVTLVMQADAAYVSYKQRSLHLLGFMSEAHIDSQVTHRASMWLMQWWHAHGGVNMDRVIGELPPSLSLEIRMHVFATATRSVQFWGPSTAGPALSTPELLKLAKEMRFASYNPGEWVLRKGMLNDDFYVVAFGVLQVLLDDGTCIQGGRRRVSLVGNRLTNMVIAEVGRGECVGEHSAINRGKCEASLRAKGSVELLVLPRASMLQLCKRNPLLKSRLSRLMSQRFSENLYLTTGKLSVVSAAKAVGYMRKFVTKWRSKRNKREAAEAEAPAPDRDAPSPPLGDSPNLPTPKSNNKNYNTKKQPVFDTDKNPLAA